MRFPAARVMCEDWGMPSETLGAVASPGINDERFFLASIGEDGSDVRKRSDGVMNFIVAKAAGEFGLQTIRADKIAHPGQMNIQVINQVLETRAAVADLTGLNTKVFYEIALRHAAKRPLVIIAEKDTKLLFDIARMRSVFFCSTDLEDADRCRAAIVAQLREALEQKIADSPVSTSIDAKALRSGSAIERSVAELVTSVQELTLGQAQIAREFRTISLRLRRDLIPSGVIHDLALADRALHALASGDKGDDGLIEVARLQRSSAGLSCEFRRHSIAAMLPSCCEMRRWRNAKASWEAMLPARHISTDYVRQLAERRSAPWERSRERNALSAPDSLFVATFSSAAPLEQMRPREGML